MSKYTFFVMGLMIVAMVAAGPALADDMYFTQSVSDDWADGNNWSPYPVSEFDMAVIGMLVYPDVSAVVKTGTAAESAGFEISNFTHGSLTIEAGASLDTYGWCWVGYKGNAALTSTLDVQGQLYIEDGIGLSIGCTTTAVVTIGADANVTFGSGAMAVGMDYHMGGTEAPGPSYGYTVDQSGTLTLESAAVGDARALYITGQAGYTTEYRLHGGTINANGVNATYSGMSYWHMGGTMEITADSEINASIAPMVISTGTGDDQTPEPDIGGPNAANWTIPVLKFSGTDTTLAMNGDVYFRFWDQHAGQTYADLSSAAEIDVSELTVSASGEWHTIIDVTGSSTDADYLSFVASTDANWEIQVVAGDVQVRYLGDDCTVLGDLTGDLYVDDKDLSLILANWHATGTPYDIAGDDDYIDDKDLSIILANWHASCPAPAGAAVPEPMTLAMLGVGALAILRRRRR